MPLWVWQYSQVQDWRHPVETHSDALFSRPERRSRQHGHIPQVSAAHWSGVRR
ncbi:MAG: hypothetical protein ACJA09_001382 [Alcanivorax sp.]|jgi:hypothetical protein